MRYLDIREGALYAESQLHKIEIRLRELPFLDASSAAHVVFKATGARMKLYLHERRANLLNGIIGLQPNSSETGKLLLTVDAQAAFQNLLAQGESVSFSFQNLQPKSPRIKAAAVYPFVLGTPFGADGNFDLYFRNTEFRRTSAELGGRYALNALDYFRLYYRGSSNRVITPDTAYVLAFHRLPENIDLRNTGGGMELSFSRTDYRPNPSRGWSLSTSAAVLNREVLRNDGITGISDGTGFDFSKLYDALGAESRQFQVQAEAAVYFHLAKRIVLKTGYSGGWMSGERLFQNELFQIGGFRLLRGFDEGSLYANQFHIATAELRLLLSMNSNFYFFSDNGWLQSNINGFVNEGLYHGVGLGTSLDTKSGLFSIACALGKSPGVGFQWRQAKVHVGYAAYF
jgi:outer membrane protein assembly factor BamA